MNDFIFLNKKKDFKTAIEVPCMINRHRRAGEKILEKTKRERESGSSL